MSWLLAGLAGIGFVEALINLPFVLTLSSFRITVSKVFSILSSRNISDHWKERALPIYAFSLLKLTLFLAAYLVVAFTPFVLLYVVSIAVGIPFLEFTLSKTGMLYVSIISIVYAKVRLASGTARP